MDSNNKETILIVDDTMMNRALLSDIFCDSYNIIEAEDGEQAIAILQNHSSEISLIILDMIMPKIDGFGVLDAMNKNNWIRYIPVMAASSENSTDFVERAFQQGVTDFIERPFDSAIIIQRARNLIKLFAKQRQLASMVANELFEKERDSKVMISILAHIVEFRNGESGMHLVNVGKITEILLDQLIKHDTPYYLPYEMRNLIVTASALHDIGKIAIDEKILNKPGRLTDEEFEIMKQHSVIGYEMLSSLPFQNMQIIQVSREIIRWHHERYDGRGYPDGLKGDEIPISAQVTALADVYDALTSERVYKKAFSHEKAVQMIMNGECGTFNPLLLECLLETQDTIRQETSNPEQIIDSYEDFRLLAPVVQQNSMLDITEHALERLKIERDKSHFFTEVSRHLHFDYDSTNDILSIPAWAAKRSHLPSQILDPAHNETITAALGPDMIEHFAKAIRSTTAQNPLIRLDCALECNDTKYDCILVARSLWASDSSEKMTGFVGRVLRKTGEEDWLESTFELEKGRGTTRVRNVTPGYQMTTPPPQDWMNDGKPNTK